MLSVSAFGGPGRQAHTATRITYRGWAGSIRLANRSAEVVVVPAIGRIMRFAPAGGPNMLWENQDLVGQLAAPDRKDWANFGGDKVWPAPQARWGWPPDMSLDGSPWTARVRPDRSVVMESPTSTAIGLRIRRTIFMHATAARVTVRNALINASDKPAEWSVWEVAQVDAGSVSMPRNKRSAFRNGCFEFPDNRPPADALTIHGDRIDARRHVTQAYKIGGDPQAARLTVRKGLWVFSIAGPQRSRGVYPDEGCSVEVYSSPDPPAYMEMEVLSPIVTIGPGRSAELMTTWTVKHARD